MATCTKWKDAEEEQQKFNELLSMINELSDDTSLYQVKLTVNTVEDGKAVHHSVNWARKMVEGE